MELSTKEQRQIDVYKKCFSCRRLFYTVLYRQYLLGSFQRNATGTLDVT